MQLQSYSKVIAYESGFLFNSLSGDGIGYVGVEAALNTSPQARPDKVAARLKRRYDDGTASKPLTCSRALGWLQQWWLGQPGQPGRQWVDEAW